jgi:putative two-component system response regulator
MKELSECTIMIVDDVAMNIDLLVSALGSDYELVVATNGFSALEIARNSPPDLVLLDVSMPDMDGYEVCQRLKENPRTEETPVIFLSALSEVRDKTRGFSLGAVDYVTKPFQILEVKARIKTHLSLLLAKQELMIQREILEEKVKERTKDLVLTQEATIDSMAILAEFRDPETGGHINRTKHYVLSLGRFLQGQKALGSYFSDTVLDLLFKSTPLHDIGKVGVPDRILLKPGRLTPSEFEEMKKHVIYGRDAIQQVERRLGENSFLRYAKEIAYTHHERWDGTGYPEGLRGDQIPISGRLMAIADVYDALISTRVYKPPLPHSDAVSIIREGRGKHFDPQIADAFLELQEEFLSIASEYLDPGEELHSFATPHRSDLSSISLFR